MKLQVVINILCLLVLIAGLIITVSDGMIVFFGLTKAIQYVFNAAYLMLIVPGCIVTSNIYEIVWGEDER